MITIGRDIAEKKSAISAKHCNSAIGLFEANPQLVVDLEEEGFYRKGSQYSDLAITRKHFPKFHDFMINQIQNTLDEYTKLLGLNERLGSGIEKISIMKFYQAKGNFQHHFDSQGEYFERRLAMIWYLNNVHEGGELTFPTSSTPITISPEEGKVVVTPCDWTHSHFVTAPITNERYSIISFITQ